MSAGIAVQNGTNSRELAIWKSVGRRWVVEVVSGLQVPGAREILTWGVRVRGELRVNG